MATKTPRFIDKKAGQTLVHFDEYASEISFRFIPTNLRAWRAIQTPYARISANIPLLSSTLERLNTAFPSDTKFLKSHSEIITRIPRMSTLSIGALINHAVSEMSPDRMFLNIGIWHGFTLISGILNNPDKPAMGVDNFSQFGGPKDSFTQIFQEVRSSMHQFVDMDFRDYFFNKHKGEIGVYVYDGPHTRKDQLDALELADGFLAEGSVVFIDDTNWEDSRSATLEFVESHGNSYRIILDIRTGSNAHPTFWNGLMVLQKTSRP